MTNTNYNNGDTRAIVERIKKLEKIAVMDKAMIECSKILLSDHGEVNTSINNLLEYICQFYEGDYACIYERDYQSRTAEIKYAYESKDLQVGCNQLQPFPYENHTKFSQELVKHEYLFLEDGDLLLETNFSNFSTKLYCGNLLAVPIMMGDVLCDVICIHGIKNHFDSFELMITIAALILNNIQINMSNEKLETLVNYDDLTGLCTEYRFRENIKELLLQHPERNYSIITANLDNFKYINNIYGYEVGTKVLMIIGELLRRVASFPKLVTRNYADNFLLLVETDGIERLVDSKEQLFASLIAPIKAITSEDFTISYSLGYYDVVDRDLELNYMIDCSATAMKKGKGNTGYTLHKFTEEMHKEQIRNGDITATMHDAIGKREFIMYYQPKVSLVDGSLVGAEALVRWIRNGQLVPPNDFIPLFEKNGFIEKLDYYVLDSVCRFIKEYQGEAIPRISVNLSGITLMRDDLMEQYKKILGKYGVRQEQIVVEVTESALAIQFAEAVERIESLRAEGFVIAMDDFGTGVSSLNRLKEVNIDLLKMDRGFIVDAVGNPKGITIIRNMLNMALELELESIGEGIETEEELEMMKELGCSIGQGYYFAKPMSEEKFLEIIKEV